VRITGVDSSGYPELRVSVVAPLGTGQPALRENGAAVAGLNAVSLGRAKSVVLAVDRSTSMTGAPLAAATAAARAFIAAAGAGDSIEVVGFGHRARAVTSFASSSTDTQAALARLQVDPVSGTALWDSVVLAANGLARSHLAGRVIIVLTDGRDVSSSHSLDDAIAAAHRANASVYTVGILSRDFTPAPLRELAARTGGSYHEATASTQLAPIYASISRTLVRTWELRYPTQARPGEQVRLTALVPGAGSAAVTATLAGSSALVASSPTLLSRSAWNSPLAPLVVSAIVGLLVLLACGAWFASRRRLWVTTRLEPHLGRIARERKLRRRPQRSLFRQLLAATESALVNVKQFRAIEGLLERADLPLRAVELLYVVLGTGALFALLGSAFVSSPAVVLFLAALGGSLPIVFVKLKASARLRAFDNQLPDLLITIAASLKAGHSFRHAIQSVAEEAGEPTAKEFNRVISETQLGRPIDDALTEMSERLGSKNLTFVITAVTIQRQIGGSLAGLFDIIADTVRQRQQFARKIRGLTAMGRMSAYVLAGLPFVIALAITALDPTYMTPLYHSSTGHALIVVGLLMICVGSLILKKMVAFKG
jgi:tight adherence protein B